MSDAPVLAGFNKVDDLSQASDFEKKHTPHIEFSRQGAQVLVTVTVGHEVPHPNVPDHFIQWIEVRADDVPVTRTELSAVASDPIVTCVINVDPGTRVTAVESCNLHGLWVGEATAP